MADTDGLKEGDDMETTITKGGFEGENNDKFLGRKERRQSSFDKEFRYDYLGLSANKVVQERMAKHSDTKVCFADYCIKVNRRNKMQKRVLLVTNMGIYNMDPVSYKVKRRIAISDLGGISLSTLPDNFFALHVPSEYDYLMVSGRKTEVVTVLQLQYRNIMNKDLPINFEDAFEYKIGTGSYRSISFTKVDGGVSTQIFDKKAS